MQFVRNGFPNYGNTCWLNSVVQSMLALPTLQDYLYGKTHVTDDNGEPTDILSNYMQSIMKYLYRPHEKHDMNRVLYSFVNSIFKRTDIFEKFKQSDAHEFYVYLTDTIHEELGKRIKGCVRFSNKYMDRDGIYFKSWMKRKEFLEKKYSFINHHFHGISLSTIICRCGRKSQTYETFSTLQLPIPKHADTLDIYDLLAEYSTIESLDDAKCEKCNRVGEMHKEMSISIAPKILVVQVKRFETLVTQMGVLSRKNNARISFPTYLDLEKSDTVLIPRSKRKKSNRRNVYQLRSIVHHTGTINHGHYFAQIRDPCANDDWYQCNDESVIRFQNADRYGIPSMSSYMAFYESCSPDIAT